MEQEFLAYFKLIGKNSEDVYTYELMFTTNIEEVWGDDWNQIPAGMCGDIPPYTETISKVLEIKSTVLFDTAVSNTLFSMGDCVDGIIPLAWENINGYEEYPENRIILRFGDDIDKVFLILRTMNVEIIN